MNDDKPAEEIKNQFADFKILATKLNDDNKNRKKKLEERKRILEACKQGYQKWFYEHNTLKKRYCKLEQKLKIQKLTTRKRKTKYYAVNPNNYESDRESDASIDEIEIETNSDDNDDDYDKTVKKKKERNKNKFIQKSKAITNNQRKRK